MISIHALLAESDKRRHKKHLISQAISIHALLAESDSQHPPGTTSTTYFYPRSPCGERPIFSMIHQERQIISIHALLAESDRERAPALSQSSAFLSTLSLRRATINPASHTNLPGYFYPRSPCGERRDVIAVMTAAQSISIHALLAESDIKPIFCKINTGYFYPRSPCGERLSAFDVLAVSALLISIHALLAESDNGCGQYCIRAQEISIHALLAESDIRQHSEPDGSRMNFYPRSPCGERPLIDDLEPSTTHFYPRSPCGERLWPGLLARPFFLISIHALLAESDLASVISILSR